MHNLAWRLLIPPLLLAGTAWILPINASENKTNGSITVAAAADLRFAFTELAQRFEKHTGKKVLLTFAASGTITHQIQNGAPYDVFASASEDWVAKLDKAGLLVPNTRQRHAVGRIVLAWNKQIGFALKTLKDLQDPRIKKIALANPDIAPYGAAAREALKKSDLWDTLQPKLVLGENIEQTRTFIQTGNADAGIIALSDAKAPEISYMPIDDHLHAPLMHTIAVIKGTRNETCARQFITFVMSAEGMRVMTSYGFHPPEQSPGKK